VELSCVLRQCHSCHFMLLELANIQVEALYPHCTDLQMNRL
jgi:hypothetical protein